MCAAAQHYATAFVGCKLMQPAFGHACEPEHVYCLKACKGVSYVVFKQVMMMVHTSRIAPEWTCRKYRTCARLSVGFRRRGRSRPLPSSSIFGRHRICSTTRGAIVVIRVAMLETRLRMTPAACSYCALQACLMRRQHCAIAWANFMGLARLQVDRTFPDQSLLWEPFLGYQPGIERRP